MDPVLGAKLGAAGIGAGASLINTVASVFGARHAEETQQKNWKANTDYLHSLNVQDAINNSLYNVMGADRAGIAKSTLGDNAFSGSVQSPSGAAAPGENPVTSPVFDALGMAKLASDIELSKAQARKQNVESNRYDEVVDSQIQLNASMKAVNEMTENNLQSDYEQKQGLKEAFGSWTEYGAMIRNKADLEWQRLASGLDLDARQAKIADQQYKQMVKDFQNTDLYLYCALQNAEAALRNSKAHQSEANTLRDRYTWEKDKYDKTGKAVEEWLAKFYKENAAHMQWISEHEWIALGAQSLNTIINTAGNLAGAKMIAGAKLGK